ATRDLDFVIAPTREQVRGLVTSFPRSDFYVDERAALEALDTHGQFNVVDKNTGWKADFIIRKPRSFSTSEFDRRYRATLDGVELTVATAEDVLLAKLEWAKLGESERQIEDAATILRVRAHRIDREYLANWVRQLGVEAEWKAAARRAGLTSSETTT
ncbi:MAG TPA: hypothetical protein VFQ39_13285, partial [Longimicrobium sp.]|nr:hypothetical protein [Longimicrobium sp.]